MSKGTQSLHARDVAIAVDEYLSSLAPGSKPKTEDFLSFFESRGMIASDGDAFQKWKLEQAREMVGIARRFRAKSREVHQEILNLPEELEDGTKAHYWRRAGDATIDEAVQDLIILHGRVREAEAILLRRFKFYRKKFGKQIQRRLPFDAPTEL